MKHLQLMKLLNSLSSSKEILNDLMEYDDSDMVELLEMKYEKMYKIISQTHAQ